MATKTWILVVSESGTPNERTVSVEAENWMAALRAGRARLGEEAALPPGASCAVAPDGAVTILDPGSRRRFLLRPVQQGSSADATGLRPRQAEPTPKPLGVPSAPAEPSPRRVARRTVGYLMEAPPLPGPVVPVRSPEPPASGPGRPERAASPIQAGPSKLVPLFARDEDPTKESPLAYRERGYAVPQGMGRSEVERLLRAEFERLRAELSAFGPGRFVNLAAFDHEWTGRPQRAPIVTLAWKDWRDEVEIAHSEEATPYYDSGVVVTTPMPAHAETDPRFAEALEALADLPFVASLSDAVGFATRLCHDLLLVEAASGCLVDRTRNEVRVWAATGPGAAEKRGDSFPTGVGLFGAAIESGKCLRVPQANYDRRFDAGVDGRIGLEVRAALYVPMATSSGPLAVLQLLNPAAHTGFGAADEELALFIASRVAAHANRLPLRRDEVA